MRFFPLLQVRFFLPSLLAAWLGLFLFQINAEDAPAKADDNKKPDAKDVSNSTADGKIESKGEFEKDEPTAKPKEADKSKAEKPRPAEATKPGEMAGWEVVHYDGRDYVTSASISKFYRFTTHELDGNEVVLKSAVLVMKAAIGSQDLVINNIKFILSYPVALSGGKALFSRLDLCKLIDPVLRPSYISTNAPFDTVIIDAGHGGHDSGARGIYGYEKDFALKLALQLKGDLEKRGLKVVMTRKDDTFISLEERVVFSNKIPNSIFIALHFNSGPNTATGIETYSLSPQGTASIYGSRSVDALAFNGNQLDSENIALATAVHAAVVHHFKLVDRGVKRARWHVLTGLQRPGILFEGGFVTNDADGKFIASQNFRVELAKTIGDAIMNYRRAVQPPQR